MPTLSKPTNGSNADYANRIGLLFDAVNTPAAWTPTLTFETPGDLSVTYSTRIGKVFEVGSLVIADFNIVTSAFTHTTASGLLIVSGLPTAVSSDSGYEALGVLQFGGITKAGYTQFVPRIGASAATITFIASASASAPALILAGDVPTGGSVVLRGCVIYRA